MVPTALKMVYSQMTRSPQAPISVVTVGLMVLPKPRMEPQAVSIMPPIHWN